NAIAQEAAIGRIVNVGLNHGAVDAIFDPWAILFSLAMLTILSWICLMTSGPTVTPHLPMVFAGFYSAKNEAPSKAKGAKRVCIPNRSTKSAAQRRDAEEALVPQRAEMANGVRGAHQRGQAPARSQPLSLQRRRAD